MTSIFKSIADVLLAYVRTEVAATAAGVPATARICVVPGQLAWDDCECGLIAVELVSTAFSNSPPAEQPTVDQGCRGFFLVTYRVSVLRCAPAAQGHDRAPTCPALDAASSTFYDDLEATVRGVAKAVTALDDALTINFYSLPGPQPTGPQGACVGITQLVTIGVPNTYGPC